MFVDANEPVMRIQAARSPGVFSVSAALAIYRKKKQASPLTKGYCSQYYDIPDMLVNQTSDSAGSVTWYHNMWVSSGLELWVFGGVLVSHPQHSFEHVWTETVPVPYRGGARAPQRRCPTKAVPYKGGD